MTEPSRPHATEKGQGSAQVTAPVLKFTIGTIASLCAVLLPRMLAALSLGGNRDLGFVDQTYIEVAVGFSVLVGLAVMFLEWKIPRKPRDTFMATLGIPAILAGAVSGNQNAQQLQQQMQRENNLTKLASEKSDIPIESTSPDHQSRENSVALIPPVYAETRLPAQQVTRQPPLAIQIRQPRYFIVLDRSPNQQEAQAKMSVLSQRLKSANQPLSLQVQKQRNEFLVVAGGPRVRADALLEAVRLKDTYHVNPTLVEAQSKD